jgi:protein-tyrosine kinase
MSKILKAVQKSRHGLDLSQQLGTLGYKNVFPPPDTEQQLEFEQLANNLINLQSGDEGIAVTFCSTVRNEGSSFVSFNTARYISLILDKNVAWIDANFISPQKIVTQNSVDFRTLLMEPKLLDNEVTTTQFTVIPHGDRHIKQTDYLLGPNYRALLKACASRFAYTIIDAPAMNSSIDAGHIARSTFGLVVVVEAQRLKHEIIAESIQAQENSGVNVIGTVLNNRSFEIPSFLYKKMSNL